MKMGLRSLKIVQKSSTVLDIILLPYTNITIKSFTKIKTLGKNLEVRPGVRLCHYYKIWTSFLSLGHPFIIKSDPMSTSSIPKDLFLSRI